MKLSEFTLRDERDDLVHRERLSVLLQKANQTQTSYPRDKTVPGLFVEHANRAPDATAVIYEDVHLRYGELDQRSSQLARFLLGCGLESETPVGVMLDRSPDTIVAMLGVMKAGGCYLPINPELPLERINQMVRDSRAPILISELGQSEISNRIQAACPELRYLLKVRGKIDGAAQRFTWEFEFEGAALDLSSVSGPIDRSRPGTLSYVLYTSGTTGIPKGVMIEHQAIMRLVLNTNYVELGPGDRTLQMHSSSFDASIFEIWGALLNGGAICIPRLEVLLDASELTRLIRQHRVTTVVLMTGLFNALVADHLEVFDGLRTVITGGEKASAHHFNRLRQAYPALSLINGYGPTENTAITTCYEARKYFDKDVPIGTPIANTSVYILSQNFEQAGIGDKGELCTGGDGLARGYLNDPSLTAQNFIPHPLGMGERLYRTGDLACWRDDGMIDFLGRSDAQVKIRGYRIELDEIETRLLQFAPLKQAVVLDKTEDGDHFLVAYFTACEQVDVEALRTHLKKVLPHYMIPGFLVQLERLPLTPNNKVDRNALPDHRRARSTDPGASGLPENETEKELIAIWQEVLNRPEVGINEDFFELGGQSLDIVMLTHLIQQKLGFALPFTLLFKAPTIHELASSILDATEFGESAIDHPLVPLSVLRTGPSVFGFPPGTGDALGYSKLADHLKPFAFYAFNFIELETRLKDYAELITGVDPVGPYRLFGYSGGGNLAFRTAVELESRGKTVSDVVMLDSSRFLETVQLPTNEPRRLATEFLDSDEVKRYVKGQILRDKVLRTIDRYFDYLSSTQDDDIINANIHVVISENSEDNYYDESGRLVISKSAWADVTRGNFRTYQGHGDHAHMLQGPHTESNAVILREILSSASHAMRHNE